MTTAGPVKADVVCLPVGGTAALECAEHVSSGGLGKRKYNLINGFCQILPFKQQIKYHFPIVLCPFVLFLFVFEGDQFTTVASGGAFAVLNNSPYC